MGQEGFLLELLSWGMTLTIFWVCGENITSEYRAFLLYLDGVLKAEPAGDSIILLGDFSAHLGTNLMGFAEGMDYPIFLSQLVYNESYVVSIL